MTAFFDIAISGVFHAAVLFLVAAGLQLVFGVQKIVNLACGSFYAVGAYFGIASVDWAVRLGLPPALFLVVLLGAGASLALIGPPIERLLRPVYDRDEAFQLLLTFALVLMFQDAIRFIWGPAPLQLGNLYMVYGRVVVGGVAFPAYNLVVIAASLGIAVGLGWFLQRTNTGRILRATAEDRETAQALGVDVGRMYALVFTLGTALGTLGGALVAPASAASLDMAVELVVEAFAVVVIGGLGSMPGALAGALIVGLMRAGAISIYPEAEILAIYLVVVLVLVMRPAGLFGQATA
ncbi:MAG: branched-chain amino acid ABC transporter permease [Proteobacteria bacterium]|nr:branched-chain amino acid ABC transporter permease [Pseudomonadota bacterium]